MGYTLATFVTLLLVAFALLRLHDQGRTLRDQQTAIATQQFRSCQAIKGAGEFWAGVRDAMRFALTDPNLSIIQRQAYDTYVELLNKVVIESNQLGCTKEAP